MQSKQSIDPLKRDPSKVASILATIALLFTSRKQDFQLVNSSYCLIHIHNVIVTTRNLILMIYLVLNSYPVIDAYMRQSQYIIA